MIYLRLTVIILIFDMLIHFIVIKQFTTNVKGDEIHDMYEVRFSQFHRRPQ